MSAARDEKANPKRVARAPSPGKNLSNPNDKGLVDHGTRESVKTRRPASAARVLEQSVAERHRKCIVDRRD
jgi:hypothetical protein